MTSSAYTVFIVDDDPAVRDALGLLLGLQGHPVVMFADAESFLSAFRPQWRGCLLVDIRMPGMDGLALQKRLLEMESTLPVIVMTGHGNVDCAREAFRAQAVDFLEKPVDHGRLLAAINEAFARQKAAQTRTGQREQLDRLLATLTPREREVMVEVVKGRHNREIADLLGISARTVEVHKARMMTKLGVDGVPALVRLSLLGQDKSAE
ncbi:response regulator transcription factor [Propionivibrio limicola]|uniref:response regulator transcription factor n=1 Tax=Propionivibrio limicola TaxID=167645 RepID=UPI001291E4FC|nr:sigma-70 family RNA polymerase sigma factor [Propionivibrio limicola]